MTALNDAGRKSSRRDDADGTNRALPVHVGRGDMRQNSRLPAWLPPWNFIAAVIAIGGMQLLATMDSTVAIVALPKIQDELGLSCLLYTSPSPRDGLLSRMPSSA